MQMSNILDRFPYIDDAAQAVDCKERERLLWRRVDDRVGSPCIRRNFANALLVQGG